jgi:hypothetical protein
MNEVLRDVRQVVQTYREHSQVVDTLHSDLAGTLGDTLGQRQRREQILKEVKDLGDRALQAKVTSSHSCFLFCKLAIFTTKIPKRWALH